MATRNPKEPTAISVSFKSSIRADGEILRVRIIQDKSEINLTAEQAQSLAAQLISRFKP